MSSVRVRLRHLPAAVPGRAAAEARQHPRTRREALPRVRLLAGVVLATVLRSPRALRVTFVHADCSVGRVVRLVSPYLLLPTPMNEI